MLDKIRERGAEMGRRLSVGRAAGVNEQPRRLSIGALAISMEKNTAGAGGTGVKIGGVSPRSGRKRLSLDHSPGDISSHLYTAMVGALLADPPLHPKVTLSDFAHPEVTSAGSRP